MAVRAVSHGVLDPPVVGGERPLAVAWRALSLSPLGDVLGTDLRHLASLSTWAVSPQGAKPKVWEECKIS